MFSFDEALYRAMSRNKLLICIYEDENKKSSWDDMLRWLSYMDADEALEVINMGYWDYK